jgi:hypothetical protein
LDITETDQKGAGRSGPLTTKQEIKETTMSQNDKDTANHLYNRVRVYEALIDAAIEECDFDEQERLEKAQGEIRAQLRQIIGL